jgi:hypothetical protein
MIQGYLAQICDALFSTIYGSWRARLLPLHGLNA